MKKRMLKDANPAADPQVAWGQEEEGLFCSLRYNDQISQCTGKMGLLVDRIIKLSSDKCLTVMTDVSAIRTLGEIYCKILSWSFLLLTESAVIPQVPSLGEPGVLLRVIPLSRQGKQKTLTELSFFFFHLPFSVPVPF